MKRPDSAGPAPAPGGDPVRLTIEVSGQVQGVGFRSWTRSQALSLELVGFAENRPDGRVAVVAEGPHRACESLLDAVQSAAAPGRVAGVLPRWSHASGGLRGFLER